MRFIQLNSINFHQNSTKYKAYIRKVSLRAYSAKQNNDSFRLYNNQGTICITEGKMHTLHKK